MLRVGLAILCALFAVPSAAHAECALAGRAEAMDVTPRGASLMFGIDEEARISIEGTHATVQGITPVAFVGRARARDVSVYLAAAEDVRGVLRIEAGTPLGVRRERDGRVRGWITAGPTRVLVSLPCGALALSESDDTSHAETGGAGDGSRLVRIRERVLRAYPSAAGGTAVELRLRPDMTRDAWPDLEVEGARGTRLHVRAELGPGVRLDAWIERDSVGYTDGAMSGASGASGDGGACGHGYGNQTYAGPARIRAGAELRDDDGHVWGQVVVDTSLVVAVTTLVSRWTSSTRWGTTRRDTVWVESIPGLVASPCSGLAARVDREAVTLPTDG